MEKEHQILSYLQSAEAINQRQIANGTGLSLGSVNILLKKLVKKGLVKIERLNARSLRYILTPHGLAEKSKLTYRYIKHSYAQITNLTIAVEKVIQKIERSNERCQKDDSNFTGAQRRSNGKTMEPSPWLSGASNNIYLYGPQNEVLEVLSLVLGKAKINHTYITADHQFPAPSSQVVIIVWDQTDEDKLSKSFRTVNILKELNQSPGLRY